MVTGDLKTLSGVLEADTTISLSGLLKDNINFWLFDVILTLLKQNLYL
jgi:hypothetical protein